MEEHSTAATRSRFELDIVSPFLDAILGRPDARGTGDTTPPPRVPAPEWAKAEGTTFRRQVRRVDLELTAPVAAGGSADPWHDGVSRSIRMEVGEMDKIVHFEIPVDDLGRAKDFYGTTFGWGIEDAKEMPYTLLRTVSVDDTQMPIEPGAINGGMMKRSDDITSPVLTIEVASVSDALERIAAGGGTVVMPRQEIPGMGAFAYFKDTEGNTLGLWESLR
jgi:predicted enzyme related to lactoylglutathione lyase